MNQQPSRNDRVLVIDDNQDIHMDFQKILCGGDTTVSSIDEEASLLFGNAIPTTTNQFTLLTAFQGQEGLQLVKQAKESGEPIAVAFVDMRMPPGWDGLTTITHLWKEDPNLEIVICTAYSDRSWNEIISTLRPTGQLLILKKPFDIVEVLQMTTTLVEKWNLNRTIEARMGQQEQALTDVETQLRMVFETSMIGMALVASDGKCLRVNESLCDLFECSAAELLRVEFSSFFHPDAKSQVSKRIETLLGGEAQTYSVETRLVSNAGATIWVQLDVSSGVEPKGPSGCLCVHVKDITDRINAENLARHPSVWKVEGEPFSPVSY